MTEKSWYLTLGFNPYDTLPTEAEANSAFGKYRNTIGKMSTKSSADADDLKALGESLDKERASIVSEVQSSKAQVEARIALMSIAGNSVDMMKLQSSEFDDTMIDLVLRETKTGLKSVMYPKGKNDLSRETIVQIISARGGTVSGEESMQAREAYEALQIDEKLKSKFRSIDANLAKVPMSTLYDMFAIGISVAQVREKDSAYLVRNAQALESLIPRDADSRQVNTLNLAKSAQEIFSSEELRESYDKHVTLNAVERHLGNVKTMGADGKVVSKDFAIAHVKNLAEELGNPEQAAKLFFGYIASNDVKADVSYPQVISALTSEAGNEVASQTPAASVPNQQTSTQQVPVQQYPPPNPQQVFESPMVNQQATPSQFNPNPQTKKGKSRVKSCLLYGCLIYVALMILSGIGTIIAGVSLS